MFTPRIIRKITKANLIGRGCNSFPTAKKWQLVRNAPGKDKYVVCNCSESEPGLFKDKYILEKFAGKVIEGIEIAMETLKATKGFIYLNPEYYSGLARILNGLIKGKKSNIELYQKPLHDYVGGEETTVLNSMEGKRVEPRLKPPFPTTNGFYNAPTLVNNCETFYAVSQIQHNEYHQTRFYCYSEFNPYSLAEASRRGLYKNQKTLELPVDITVKKALQEFKYQPSKEYFYQISGGASGTCYNHQQLNRPFEGLASIIVYKTNLPEKDVVMHWANFFEQESCGQCVTCREGTYRLQEILEKYYATGKLDKNLFDDLVHTLQNTSFCPLGGVSTNAILSYWKNVKKKY